MFIHILSIILFIFIGLMFFKGKGSSMLIFVDNPELLEKNEQLKKDLSKFAAIVCFIIAIAISKNLVGEFSELYFLIESSAALMAFTAFAMLLTLFKGSFIK